MVLFNKYNPAPGGRSHALPCQRENRINTGLQGGRPRVLRGDRPALIRDKANPMTAPVVLVTSTQLSERAQQILRDAGAAVSYMSDPVITEDILAARLAREGITAVLMRGSPPFTRRVLEAAANLKIIAKHGAGFDSVDLDAATARGIVVVTAGAANADAVAEHTLALMLSLARELPRLHRNLRNGLWEKGKYQGREFRGRAVGIVGYGEIGRRVAGLAAACGARVVIHSRSRVAEPAGAEVEEDFDRLLGKVDILSLHCPLTEQTRGLIGDKQLRLMRPGALLINTARGGLVDEQALVDALSNGRLAGAGLDTFAQEPPDPKNPLFTLDNVICSPHVAAMTVESMARMGTIAANNIIGYLQRGICDSANVVNPAVFKK
jgi:D-3-phosphoglycerate dehydrogenase